ncbi:hypothetical protein SALBM217S_04451 [Streptomyces griseoloalbus]
MTDLLHSRGRVSLFPDNTVLCNFGTVGRLDLLRKVLDGCGRWTEAVAEEARRSAAYVRDLARLEAEGWLGEPIELCTDAEIALADRLRRAVFGGLPTEPLRHLGEAETLALIQTRREFTGAVWITDDRDAGEYASARGIPVKNTVALNGCRPAIDKATAILLDQGKLGVSLGLDSAVHTIDTALSKADIRLARWRSALDKLPAGEPVEIATLTEAFPGVDEQGGTFRTHIEMAALAIALKRRVNVLQAVERAQSEPDNLFENFARALKDDERRLDELESGMAQVLVRLSTLELARPSSKRPVLTNGEVDRLLRATYQIRSLGDGVALNGRPADVAIEMARERDGSLVVFPALPAHA